MHLERLRSHLEALWLLCPLLKGDENWTLPIPARFLLDRASVIFYSEHPLVSKHVRFCGADQATSHCFRCFNFR